ncbi:hypothetical protein BDD12DRAFT_869783 [Trichophaea hybrida]|nr:hypothetical protein BDD12DRAFT_869783 [Trichophaea hybrida]
MISALTPAVLAKEPKFSTYTILTDLPPAYHIDLEASTSSSHRFILLSSGIALHVTEGEFIKACIDASQISSGNATYLSYMAWSFASRDLPLPKVTIPGGVRRQYVHLLRNNTLRTKGTFCLSNVTVEIAKHNVSVPPPGELLCVSASPSVLPFTFVLARQYDIDAKLPMTWWDCLKVLFWTLFFVGFIVLMIAVCAVNGSK